MSRPIAYSPLEELLLFQALRSEPADAQPAFNRISEQLNSIPLVRSHPNYDSGRLSPDALRELYLWLLKEEAKDELDRQLNGDKVLQNGDLSPNARKRKAASPSLPTVQEASKHAHLIPQLVDRLYARYREHTVREIREQERRYDGLARDIEDIEAGKRDDRLQREKASALNAKNSRASPSVHAGVDNASPTPRYAPEDGERHSHNKADSLINQHRDQQNGVSAHHHGSAVNSGPLPPQQMAHGSEALGVPPSDRAFNQTPVSGQHPPGISPHAQAGFGSASNAQAQQLYSTPSSSPRPHHHPPGLPYQASQPGSSAVHGHPMSQRGQYPQYPPQAATLDPAQFPYPASQPPGSYYAPPGYVDHRGQYVQPPPMQAYPGPYSHPGGYPPHGYPMDGAHAHHQPSAYPTNAQPYSPYPATAPSTGPRPTRRPDNIRVTDIIGALATPPRREQKPVWKRGAHQSVKRGTPKPRPEEEPLSPGAKAAEPTSRATRSTRNRGATMSEQPEELESLPMPARSRGRAARERTPHSVASSNADESAQITRSQSVSTAAAFPASDDRPGSQGDVKVEPSTPAAFGEDGDPTAQDQQSGGRLTRKRRGTLQSLSQPSQKRRRQQSLPGFADGDADWDNTPPPKPSTVIATRNFHKLSQTIMNDINSHKHASYFANAVRDKDAPGYSSIIKYPQNLKSIRAAISAGSKAIQAATTESPTAVSDTPTKGAGSGADWSATVELERTEDLCPPKAIVNAAQLEKEVLRMFANAVMFNPGDDGLVADAREMFEDVEAKLSEWKGVEKEVGTRSFSASNEAADEEEGSKGKRRKL